MKSLSRLPVIAVTLVGLLSYANSPMLAPAQETPAAVAAEVDRLLAEELDFASESEAPLSDDATFLRRISLDITGQLPPPEQIIAFSLDPDPAKRSHLVEQMLADESYGQNWSNYWRDVIFYRRIEKRSLFGVETFEQYMATSLNENVPWNEIATSMITAEGDVRAEGSTALIASQAGKAEGVASEISRIFMGIQISCAQCHDHKTDQWKREQFHELAAFFPRLSVRPKNNGGMKSLLVVSTDTPGRRANGSNRPPASLEHTMPPLDEPNRGGRVMVPTFFLTGEAIEIGTSDAERRSQLAQLITTPSNEWFSKAIVNRLWSELVGEGFCEPVDDIGPDRECRTEATFGYLAQSFVEHGHDMKWLFRVIMETDAYQRNSRDRRLWNESPFLANCPQPLRADELIDALITTFSLDLSESEGERNEFGAYGGIRGEFNNTFGYDPSLSRDNVSGSIPQALALMNSPLLEEAVQAGSSTGWDSLLGETEDDETVVMELYLRSFSREPTEDELKTCLEYVSEVGDRREAFEDILWVIVNSTEFIHRQ